MNVTYRAIFQLFGVPSDSGYYLPIHGDAVQLYEDGRAFCSHGGIVEEGLGPYADLPLPSELESLFVMAFVDAKKPSAKVYALPTNHQPIRIAKSQEGATASPRSDITIIATPIDPDALHKALLARYDAATEEVDAPHPNYPTNPSKRIKVRVVKIRMPPKDPCPWCAGQGVAMWLGKALLCGACCGTGEHHTSAPPDDGPPLSVA